MILRAAVTWFRRGGGRGGEVWSGGGGSWRRDGVEQRRRAVHGRWGRRVRGARRAVEVADAVQAAWGAGECGRGGVGVGPDPDWIGGEGEWGCEWGKVGVSGG